MPTSLSRVDFASYLIYPTRSTTPVGRQAKQIVNSIKEDSRYSPTQTYCQRAAERLRVGMSDGYLSFGDFLNSTRLLVPVPRAGLLTEDALWPSKRIADCLTVEGLGAGVFPCLKRIEAIPSSRLSGRGLRPPLDRKYSSLGLELDQTPLLPPERLTLIDDAISTGATLFGAAMRLAEAFQRSEIVAFGIARVRGDELDPAHYQDPHIGFIERTGEWSVRRDD